MIRARDTHILRESHGSEVGGPEGTGTGAGCDAKCTELTENVRELGVANRAEANKTRTRGSCSTKRGGETGGIHHAPKLACFNLKQALGDVVELLTAQSHNLSSLCNLHMCIQATTGVYGNARVKEEVERHLRLHESGFVLAAFQRELLLLKLELFLQEVTY